MVKRVLRIAYKNESDAKEAVIKKLYGKDAHKYSTYIFSDLFDSRKSTIYLKNLHELINSNWSYFADYFGNQEIFTSAMNVINKEGRFDAHATIPDENEITLVNGAIQKIKEGIDKFNNI
jgi:hypothetical protein